MKYTVQILAEAEEDLFQIYQYVASHDSPGKAENLYQELKKTILSLDCQPTRGHVPPELERLDVREFLEIHYKPYRIIYQIIELDVFVHCVFDGRRQLDDLLRERLLRM